MGPKAYRVHSRDAVLSEVRARFIAKGYPRLHALLILGLSGVAAFLFSAGTLKLGLEQMGVRYFLGTLVGYATFLILIRAWIAYQRPGWRFDCELPDIGTSQGPETARGSLFDGGRSSGAGGGSRWDATTEGRGAGVDVDFDELWPLVLALIFALGGLLALSYVVYAAPLMLAEVALDAALVTGLYRKLRKEDARHWLDSALRRTWLPALIAGMFLMLAGLALQWAVPTAQSIGDVWRTFGN